MRTRSVGLIALFIVALAGAATLATNNQQIVLYDPAGGPITTQIDGSKPSYVSHGWTRNVDKGVPASVVHDEMYESGFELQIDEIVIDPTSVNITRTPAKKSFTGEAMWDYLFTYRFPARFFSEGLHVFTGTWFWPDPDNPGSMLSGGFERLIEVVYP